jgi:hypothetical protein
VVRPRSPETNFKSSGRKEVKGDPSGGPGGYNVLLQSTDRPMTIGVKRFDQTEKTPGPGDYEPARGDSQTKIISAAYDFSKTASVKTLGYRVTDTTVGPGQYSPERVDKKSNRKVNFARGSSRSMS